MSNKLKAKSDRCIYVGYPKEILDIISTKLWNKSYLFQGIQSSKVAELGEVQSAQIDTYQLTLSKAVIHIDEVVADPSKTQAHSE